VWLHLTFLRVMTIFQLYCGGHFIGIRGVGVDVGALGLMTPVVSHWQTLSHINLYRTHLVKDGVEPQIETTIVNIDVFMDFRSISKMNAVWFVVFQQQIKWTRSIKRFVYSNNLADQWSYCSPLSLPLQGSYPWKGECITHIEAYKNDNAIKIF
jgi:hypothetical protein